MSRAVALTLLALIVVAALVAYRLHQASPPPIAPDVLRHPDLVEIAKATMAKRLPKASFPPLSQDDYSTLRTPRGRMVVMGTAFLDGEALGWSVILDGQTPVSLKIGDNGMEAAP